MSSPSYSFVLGDLHAFSDSFWSDVLGILFLDKKTNSREKLGRERSGLLGLLLGMFLFPIHEGFMIYYVVICGTLLFGNLKRYSSGSL